MNEKIQLRCLLVSLLSAMLLGVVPHVLLAQQPYEVRIGDYRIVPPANAKELAGIRTRGGGRTLPDGRQVVLLQLYEQPTPAVRAELSRCNVTLNDYLGGNAYFATLRPWDRIRMLKSGKIRSVMAIEPGWKISQVLVGDNVPDFLVASQGKVRVSLAYHASVDDRFVRQVMLRMGIEAGYISTLFRSVDAELSAAQMVQLAEEPWVVAINPQPIQPQLDNYRGRVMTNSHVLAQPSSLGGRGLTGAGVKVGVFDGDVERHVDFGKRIHVQESAMSVKSTGGHGIHVSGTMAGAGVLDPLARGVAPEVDFYSYNFLEQPNGMKVSEKMLEAARQFNISITQNSYGVAFKGRCNVYNRFSYNGMENSWETDYITNLYPHLLHVYSVGNDRATEEENCGHVYGSSTKRSKNALYVGALNADESMGAYSSWGPMDDGRLLPTVVALGTDVYSTRGGNSYGLGTGSSMACPAVSGIAALLTERYRQLNDVTTPRAALLRGVIANTARDMGNVGPDYQYGYGLVDAEKAVEVLEKGWFFEGKLEAGMGDVSHTIEVPANAKELRVMLVWSDTVSNKQYGYGESALINDLDLQVAQSGSVTLPWVLDPSNPQVPATRGVDSRNNMEQVTVENPAAGSYEITVKPTRIASQGQEYAVVYWIEGAAPAIVYPLGGELLAPGDKFYIRWKGMESPIKVEMSVDGGESYSTIATGVSADKLEYELPNSTPSTAAAFIRLTAANGTVKNLHPFSVIGVPQKVVAEEAGCGESITLRWSAVAAAAEYEVMKADVEKGTFELFGTTSDTSMVIPYSKLSADTRNVFTVRTRIKTGEVGRRAKGIAVKAAMPLVLTKQNIPFVEHFEQFPLQFVQVEMGKNMEISYPSEYPETKVDTGHHLMGSYASATQKNSDWRSDSAFATKTNMNRISMCSVDLTNTGYSALHLTIPITQVYHKLRQNSSVRVLINGVLAKDFAGDSIFQAATPIDYRANKLCFDLTPFLGQVVSIEIQHVSRDARCMIVIHEIKIAPPDSAGKVELTKFETTELLAGDSPRNDVRVEVLNNQPRPLPSLAVSYRIDDRSRVVESIADLKPYERRLYTFLTRADLSSKELCGHVFNLTGELLHPDTANAKAHFQAINTGQVYPLAYSPLEDVPLLGRVIHDPKRTVVVQDSLIFTPYRGAFFGYDDNQESTVRFKPSNPAKRLRVLFERFDTEKGADGFFVYNCEVPEDLELEKVQHTDLLTGSFSNRELLASTKGGDITLKFSSDISISGKGWLARITEEDPVNIFTLRLLTLESYYSDQEATISITIRNNTDVPRDSVRVAYYINDSHEWEVETIKSVIKPSSEMTYTFPAKASLPFGGHYTVTARILAPDYDESDNIVSATVTNDIYCHDVSIKEPKALFIKGVKAADGKEITMNAGAGNIDYHLDSPFTIYAGSPVAQFFVTTSASLTDSTTIALYIDWNADGQFDESTERIKVSPAVAGNVYRFDVSVPASRKIGKTRMRAVIGKNKELNAACPADTLTLGDVKDFLLDVKDAPFPVNDVALTALEVKSGRGLKAEEPITIKLKNYGAENITTLEITLEVNGAKITEEANVDVPAFGGGAYTYTLQHKLDLSTIGRYDIRVSIPDDQNKENNELRTISYSVPEPAPDAFYALKFRKNQQPAEYLNLGSLNGTPMYSSGGHRDITLEAWFMPQEDGKNVIFNGKNIIISTITNDTTTDFPNNAVVMQFVAPTTAKKLTVYTDSGSVTPHQWQHVAVALHLQNAGDPDNFKVFINGKRQNVTLTKGASFRSYGQENGSMPIYVASDFGGMVRQIRCWKKQLSDSILSLPERMYSSLRDATGKLPEGLIAEFAMGEGPKSAATLSDDIQATIHSSRVGSADDPVWVAPTDLITNTQFEGQAFSAEKSDPYTLTIPLNGVVKLDKVKGTIIAAWPGTSLTYKADGRPIPQDAVFDFSQPVEVVATVDPAYTFGHSIAPQTYKLVAEHISEAKLISLVARKEDNPGLANDVNAAIKGEMHIDLTGIADLASVALSFEVSSGATLAIGGTPLIIGVNHIDLSHPVELTVTSADKRSVSRYAVEAFRTQTITWDALATTDYTFGDAPQQLLARSNSNLPIVYTSSDGNVATVSGDRLLITGVGKATISAMQPGGNRWTAAEPVAQTITVKPKAVTVSPKSLEIEEQQDLPKLEFSFSGLVKAEHAKAINLPSYGVYVGGTLWEKPIASLPVGVHELKPTSGDPYRSGSYEVTPKGGKLTVKASPVVKTVTFIVKSEADETIDGATVRIGRDEYATNSSGEVQVKLRQGDYEYRVEKEGLFPSDGTFSVKNADFEVNVRMRLPEFTLSYTVSNAQQGVILANAEQHVPRGGNGMPVYALPAPGFLFSQWDDGVKSNPRVDRDVKKDISAAAQFVASAFTVTYTSAPHGRIEGETEQEVRYGAKATPVTAVPDDGYAFVRWSDYCDTPTRIDFGFTDNASFTAIFDRCPTLPYTQNFDDSFELPNFWSTIDSAYEQSPWFVSHDQFLEMDPISGGSAFGYASRNASLYSPTFAINEGEADSIALDFQYIWCPNLTGLMGVVQYKTEKSGWTDMKPLNLSFQLAGFHDTIPLVALEGAGKIQFRWIVLNGAEEGYPIVVDNVAISLVPKAPVSTPYTITYRAGQHGSLSGDTVQSVEQGKDGTPVEAIPAAGCRFVQWSDGKTDNPRTEHNVQGDLTVTAEFEAILYNVTIGALQNGSVTADCATATIGQVVTLTVTPSAGYRLKEGTLKAAKVDGTGDVPIAEGKFAMPAYDVLVTAEFEAKEEEKTGLSHEPLENLLIHPNPTQSGVYVEAEGEVRVYSAEGYLVLSAVAAGEAYLDLGSLPSGLYIIRVGNRVAKIVKR